MTRSIALLGSTGSIGRQTLEVARELGLSVAALTANKSVALIEQQAREFCPRLAVLYDEDAARELRARLSDTKIQVLSGMEGLLAAATAEDADTVVTAVMGMIGLKPTLAAIEKKKRIALANKETLVCAGELVVDAAEEYGAEIVPVDSEHSAIFQCLQGCRDRGEIKRLIDIDLVHRGLAGNLVRHLIEHRSEHLARTAPRCEKVNEHGGIRLQHLGIEFLRSNDLSHNALLRLSPCIRDLLIATDKIAYRI